MPYTNSEDFDMKVHEFDIAIRTIFFWRGHFCAFQFQLYSEKKSRECHYYLTSRAQRL